MLPVLGFVFPPTMSSANTSDALYARDKLPNVADSINLMPDEFRSAPLPSPRRTGYPCRRIVAKKGRQRGAIRLAATVGGKRRAANSPRADARSYVSYKNDGRDDAGRFDQRPTEKRYFHALVRRPAPQLAARHGSRACAREPHRRTIASGWRASVTRARARARLLAREGV